MLESIRKEKVARLRTLMDEVSAAAAPDVLLKKFAPDICSNKSFVLMAQMLFSVREMTKHIESAVDRNNACARVCRALLESFERVNFSHLNELEKIQKELYYDDPAAFDATIQSVVMGVVENSLAAIDNDHDGLS